jgi:hypothetical protein
MNYQATRPVVLARIPDLNALTADDMSMRDEGISPPKRPWRLFNQNMSFQLLCGVGVLLLAVAIMPGIFGRKASSGDNFSLADGQQPQAAAPQWGGQQVAAEQPKPATYIPAVEKPQPAPVAIPAAEETPQRQTPAAVAETPLMSQWPQRQADARSAPSATYPGGEPATEQPDASPYRNRYERPGSSLH